MTDNPCRHVKHNPEKPRGRYIEDGEYEAVRNLAPPVIQCIMDLGYMTGLRLGDLLKLNIRDNVHKDGLYVVTGKTGRKQKFDWTPELRDVTSRSKTLRGKVSSPYLICTRDGQRYTLDGLKNMWQRLMRKAVDTNVIKERFTFKICVPRQPVTQTTPLSC